MRFKRESPLADHQTIQDLVAKHIAQLILDGVLREGERINSKVLADELGTSTMPIREALHQLEAEEFVVFEPYRGVFVARLSAERLEEIYVMRAALEEFAVGLAVPRLRPEHFSVLERELRAMERAIGERNVGDFYSSDRLFHVTICDAADRPTLLKQVCDLRARSVRYSRLYQGLPGAMARALAENRGIWEACRAGDVRLAKRRTRAHIERAAKHVLPELNRQQLAPAPLVESTVDCTSNDETRKNHRLARPLTRGGGVAAVLWFRARGIAPVMGG